MKRTDLQRGLDAHKACDLLRVELGPLAKQIGAVNCPKRVLEVKVYSSTLREKLMTIKEKIRDNINEQLGHPFLIDVRFRG